MDTTTHRAKTLEHIADAHALQLELDDAYADTLHPHRAVRISKAHHALRMALKLAQIEATLDMGAAFRDWTEISHRYDDVEAPVPFKLIEPTFAQAGEGESE